MSADFIALLREAHAVYLASSLGLRTVGEIASYANISVAKAAEWAKLLLLPIEPTPGCLFDHHHTFLPSRAVPTPSREGFPRAASPTFTTANLKGA